MYPFKLPDVGEGMHEGEIVKWHVKPGDTVEEDQPLVDVQNDKATVELPSPIQGKVREILVREGTVASVGDVLATFDVVGEVDNANVGEPEGTAAQEVSNSQAVETSEKVSYDNVPSSSNQVLATPSVRRLAREKGIALDQVPPTGRNGQITRKDVESYLTNRTRVTNQSDGGTSPSENAIQAEANKAPIQASSDSRLSTSPSPMNHMEDRVPLKGVRKVIAAAMSKSVYTAPHVTIMDEVDVSKLVELRQRAKLAAEKRNIKITYLPFIMKALIAATKQFPILNASLDEETNEIVYKKYYHIGVATDTDAGLMVPVINHADSKNIWAIAQQIQEMAERAKEGKLAIQELKGSTISVTNIGSVGGMFFTPVINYPEVAILGIGRITKKPVVRDHQITIGQVLALSFSFDHRIIDGATAQSALNYMKQLLEEPEWLVMEV